jgi:hypothetical protein
MQKPQTLAPPASRPRYPIVSEDWHGVPRRLAQNRFDTPFSHLQGKRLELGSVEPFSSQHTVG